MQNHALGSLTLSNNFDFTNLSNKWQIVTNTNDIKNLIDQIGILDSHSSHFENISNLPPFSDFIFLKRSLKNRYKEIIGYHKKSVDFIRIFQDNEFQFLDLLLLDFDGSIKISKYIKNLSSRSVYNCSNTFPPLSPIPQEDAHRLNPVNGPQRNIKIKFYIVRDVISHWENLFGIDSWKSILNEMISRFQLSFDLSRVQTSIENNELDYFIIDTSSNEINGISITAQPDSWMDEFFNEFIIQRNSDTFYFYISREIQNSSRAKYDKGVSILTSDFKKAYCKNVAVHELGHLLINPKPDNNSSNLNLHQLGHMNPQGTLGTIMSNPTQQRVLRWSNQIVNLLNSQ